MPGMEFVLLDDLQDNLINKILHDQGKFLAVPYGHPDAPMPLLDSVEDIYKYEGAIVGPFRIVSPRFTKTYPRPRRIDNIHFGPMYTIDSNSWGPSLEIAFNRKSMDSDKVSIGFVAYYSSYVICGVRVAAPRELLSYYSDIRRWVLCRSRRVREIACGRGLLLDKRIAAADLSGMLGWGVWE